VADPSRILAVVDCDWMSQFAVSFVANIFRKHLGQVPQGDGADQGY
jgi:hypothetical protein